MTTSREQVYSDIDVLPSGITTDVSGTKEIHPDTMELAEVKGILFSDFLSQLTPREKDDIYSILRQKEHEISFLSTRFSEADADAGRKKDFLKQLMFTMDAHHLTMQTA